MAESIDDNGKVIYEDTEEHKYNACQSIVKQIIKEHANQPLWSKEQGTSTLSPKVCQDGPLDLPIISNICADLEKVIQGHNLQHGQGFIFAIFVGDSDDKCTTVRYQIVKPKDFTMPTANNTIVFCIEQVIKNLKYMYQYNISRRCNITISNMCVSQDLGGFLYSTYAAEM